MSRQDRGGVAGVVEDARHHDGRQEDRVHVGRGRLDVRDRVREGDAEGGEAAPPPTTTKTTREGRSVGQPVPKNSRPATHDDRHLQRGVGDGVAGERGEVGRRRHRGAADTLEDALLAQEREVHRDGREGRRHDAHARDARHDDVQVGLLAGEDRAEHDQEQQRQHEVEERRARVAPEHPALQPVLAPGGAPPGRAARAAARGRGRALQRVVAHATASVVSSR